MAPGDNTGGASAGAAYLVWGKTDGTPVNLTDVSAGVGGFKIIGEAFDDIAGHRVAAIRDLDGDGHDEILVSAVEKNILDASGGSILSDNVGAVYVVQGKADGVPVNLDAVAAGFGGYRILGEAEGDVAGADIAAVDDLNGDGRPEVLLGASGNGTNDVGAAYVVWGKANGAPLALTAVAAGIGGLKIIGETRETPLFFGDSVGASVGIVADLNGDDRPEILIGAPFNDDRATPSSGPLSSSGAVYVVFSSPDWIGAG